MYLRARGDENPRPGFDNGRQHVGQTTNAVSGLPEGRAKRVNPPLTAIIQDESLYESTGFFLFIFPEEGGREPPTGVRQRATARWTDHERSEWAARRASKASQSPRCTRRHRSKCLMAASPYQAYASGPTSCHVQLPDGGCALSGLRVRVNIVPCPIA